MAVQLENLWPEEFGAVEETPPGTLLREQAAILGEKTNHLVEAEVTTAVVTSPTHENAGGLVHRFLLKAPALENYRYLLFRAYHDPIEIYPIRIVHGDAESHVGSQEEFVERLRAIFSAESTRKAIGTLIAQSKG